MGLKNPSFAEMPMPNKREKNLRNLKPFQKGEARARMSPGRPRKPDWVAELERLAATPKERIPFLRRMLHKYPVHAMHYLAGKPLEQVRVEATTTNKFSQDDIELAAAAVAFRRAELEENGNQLKTVIKE
jgi:hypothetical protein